MQAKDFLSKLKETDEEHRAALKQTGFWGRQAAGCVFLALDTGRVCLAHRSSAVEQPNTWGTWGGAIDSGEDPATALKREVREESGYTGSMRLIPMYIFEHASGFKYYNFLALVPKEFKPKLDWETQGSDWFEIGQWPSPLHPGLVNLLRDAASARTMAQYANMANKIQTINKPPLTESISGQDMLDIFHKQHWDHHRNAKMEQYILDHDWGISMIKPADIPSEDSDLYFDSDPFGRVQNIDDERVEEYVKQLASGSAVKPIIKGPGASIIDGNHRAQAAKRLDKSIQAYVPMELVKENFGYRVLDQGVAEGLENNNIIANKIFFARSNKAPKSWSYDHVGFITTDGKQIQMSGHKGNDVYITNDITDDKEFPKQQIKIVSLPKPVKVPTNNSVGAENCGTFVANVLQANGIKGFDTLKLYNVFKKPQQQGLAEATGQIQLGPQLFVSRQTTMEDIKPRAAAWTSTAQETDQGFTSDWVKWCKNNMAQWVTGTGILYDVAPGARILLLRTDRDVIKIARQYGLEIKNTYDLFEKMDWEVLRRDYDAIHHVPQGRDLFMRAWDVESTAWFDKKFLINPRKVKIDTGKIKIKQQGLAENFADGDRYPRLAPAVYNGKPISQAAYFSDKSLASQVLTLLSLKAPNDWDLDLSSIKNQVNEGDVIRTKFATKQAQRAQNQYQRQPDIANSIPLYDPKRRTSVLPQHARGHEEPFDHFYAEPKTDKSSRIIGVTRDGRKVVTSTWLAPVETVSKVADAYNRGGFSDVPMSRVPIKGYDDELSESKYVYRIDSKHITDFSKDLKTYYHNADYSQSGRDWWPGAKGKITGVFAKDPVFTALYATGPSKGQNPTRYVAVYGPGQPTVYFDKKDVPRLRQNRSYLSVFHARSFKKLPSGEWFSERPSKPVKQKIITDPFAYIQQQGWRIKEVDNLNSILQNIKQRKARGEDINFGAEGMGYDSEIKENFADGKIKGKSRPGRVKRAGASCKGSVTDLRARAKKLGGERGKMYHWCANMKAGKKNESMTEGLVHPVICVDVQPEYCGINDGDESSVCISIIQFVNRQTGPVLMFVNAEDQGLSGDTIQGIKQYWDDTICPEEERYSYDDEYDDYVENPHCPQINWQRFTIVDKGYGYFRSWMDAGISSATIIRVIRTLYQNRVNETRDLFGGEDSPEYAVKMQELIGSEFRPWMLTDPLSVNWTSVAQLKRFNGAYIVGGARDRCLREVELLMNAFNIKYKRIDSLVYD